jgi:hypothetical protein
LGEEVGEGAAAVAEGELGLEIDFGHGAVEFWQIEEGVVAEASGASRGVEDRALDGSIGHVGWLAVAGSDKYAVVAGSALRGRDGVEALKEDDIVPDIGVVVGIGGVDQAGVGGEAGGTDTGSAGERVDFKAGVVGEDEGTGSELGIIDGLEGGVFGEGFAVFFRWVDAGQIRKGVDGDGVCFGGGSEVAQLSLAGGGYVEAEGHGMSVKEEEWGTRDRGTRDIGTEGHRD